jgi:hypothetical protein
MANSSCGEVELKRRRIRQRGVLHVVMRRETSGHTDIGPVV